MSSIGDPVQFIESRFGIQMKRAGRTEWASPCPWCGGTDRFHVWDKGNYYCRPGAGHCARSGWLDELDGKNPLTEEKLLALRVTALERKQEEHEARLSALEKIQQSTDHLTYHANLEHHPEAVEYWLSEGINGHSIHEHQLGYCSSCPTARGHASYTIPVTYQGTLYNIRHRLASPPNGGKYRPHMAGLPVMIFNADHLDRDEPDILILEGEKKSVVCSQETDLANIATMGAQSFKQAWVSRLAKFRTVYVCYDPDAISKAIEVAGYFGERGRVMDLPAKADDLFVKHDATAADFLHYVKQARPV